MTTLPLRRTQRTVVERILGALARSGEATTDLIFFMSAIYYYTAMTRGRFWSAVAGQRKNQQFLTIRKLSTACSAFDSEQIVSFNSPASASAGAFFLIILFL